MIEKSGNCTANALVTHVMHCKLSSYDIYIGRPSKWGNLYIVGCDLDVDIGKVYEASDLLGVR